MSMPASLACLHASIVTLKQIEYELYGDPITVLGKAISYLLLGGSKYWPFALEAPTPRHFGPRPDPKALLENLPWKLIVAVS